MPRRLRNWGYKDVIAFLKENGFYFYEQREGSHEAWVRKTDMESFVVEVNWIEGGKSYKPKTLNTMIAQSGIKAEEWIKWCSR